MLLQASFDLLLGDVPAPSNRSGDEGMCLVQYRISVSQLNRRVLRAFVMLEPYTVKVVRAVLRGERAVRP